VPAPTIDRITVADVLDAWRAAGFAVDDDGISRIGTVRVELVGRDRGKRIIGWSLRGASVDGDIDGLATAPATEDPADPAEHPNGVRLIDHLVLATPNQARTVKALEAAGFDVRGTRDSSTYGSAMRQVFFRAGEVILELIGDPAGDGDGPAGFYGLAFTVADLDATKQYLGDHLGTPKPAVQPGRRIATLRHKEFDMSVATALMSA
jgi:hypothetical protein